MFFQFSTLLFVFCVFLSCSSLDLNDTSGEMQLQDAQKAFLGKWELTHLVYFDRETIPYNPTGYIEYFPDSLVGWYDYTTPQDTLFEGKYWISEFLDIENDKTIKRFILHYQNIRFSEQEKMRDLYLAD
jgi:hypothetical protein